MKIIYVINSGNFGGMEKHVWDLCRGMVKKGHNVFAWCPPGNIVNSFEEAGAQVTQIRMGLDLDLLYIFKLAGFLRKKNIDIVHAHELKAVVNSLVAGCLAGVKVRISHTHTPISEWEIGGLKKRLNLFVYPKVVNKLASYEIALTPSRKKIKMEEGIKEEKLKVLKNPNAVDVNKFSLGRNIVKRYRSEVLSKLGIDSNLVIWGCLGRMTAEKGHKVLINAFSTFINELPDHEKEIHHLILAGGGKLESELKDHIKEIEKENRITITGILTHEEVVKYYSTFDYFVHPSLAEGFGIVLIEAMVTNTPVIASDLEVFKEVGEDAVLYFKAGDAKDLTRVMKEVVEGKHDLKQLTIKAHNKVVDNYSMQKFIDCYHEFYLEQLNN